VVVNARKVGAAAAPLLGPAKMALTDWVVSVPVSVPVVVTGEPDTDMMDGSDKATEVTEPVPYGNAGMSAVVRERKVGVAPAPLLGPANKVLTDWVVSVLVSVPLDVTGEPVTSMMEGMESATEVT